MRILRVLAHAVVRKYKPRIVAVTGSVGKTSAKDAIFAMLRERYHVRASEKSFNSEVGLPLTILGLHTAWGNPLRWMLNIVDGLVLLLLPAKYPEWLVLEVGADRPGDISSLSRWLPVDVAMITRLPEVPAHVEFFDSPEAVIEEKASLIDALKPGGTLLLYADDKRTRGLEQRLPAPDARIITFGFAPDAEVRGSDFEVEREDNGAHWPVGMRATLHVGEEAASVSVLGAIGPHAFLPVLAGAAVGHALGLPLGEILEGAQRYKPPVGRMRLLPGIKSTLIIDDTYNASPAAVSAGLETLAECKATRAVAVLGDMLELGRHSVEEHRKIGAHAARCADLLVTVGFRARDIAQGALEHGMSEARILQFEDSARAGKELESLIEAGDCILIKGSQSMRMERAVEELMLEPERAEELLVRQDAEWKKR